MQFLWSNCIKCLCFALNHQNHAFWIIGVKNKNSLLFFFFNHSLFCREMSCSLLPCPSIFLVVLPLSHMSLPINAVTSVPLPPAVFWWLTSLHLIVYDLLPQIHLLSLENSWLPWPFIFLCQLESQHSSLDLAKHPSGLHFPGLCTHFPQNTCVLGAYAFSGRKDSSSRPMVPTQLSFSTNSSWFWDSLKK